MNLLANENSPAKSVHYLKAKGFDIIALGVDNQSIRDSEVMSIAIKDERTILTFDRDYGELIFKHNYRPKSGVIYLRLEEYEADEPGKIVEELINKKGLDFRNSLTVVDKNGIRQRKY